MRKTRTRCTPTPIFPTKSTRCASSFTSPRRVHFSAPSFLSASSRTPFCRGSLRGSQASFFASRKSWNGGGRRAQTLAAYPQIIRALRARGYRIVTVPQLLGFQPVYVPCVRLCDARGVGLRQLPKGALPQHVAIVMDGNGRWAVKRGLNRCEGHRRGKDSVRAVVETARQLGIPYLTLFAFSNENWQRPKAEVRFLMQLFHRYLITESKRLMKRDIRVIAIGEMTRLPGAIAQVEARVRQVAAAHQ